MMDYYIFETIEQAELALAQINSDLGIPRVESNGYRVNDWAKISINSAGKYFLPVVENSNYPWAIATASSDWWVDPLS